MDSSRNASSQSCHALCRHHDLRVNAALREHLTGGGKVGLVIATAATVHVSNADGESAPFALDLSAKAARLLAENAALVTAQLAGEVDLENLF